LRFIAVRGYLLAQDESSEKEGPGIAARGESTSVQMVMALRATSADENLRCPWFPERLSARMKIQALTDISRQIKSHDQRMTQVQ
jgi:hypothetical protein